MQSQKIAGFAKGIVINTDDPAGFNRIKVRIPQLHGAMSEKVYENAGHNAAKINRVEDDSIPWAEVSYPYGTNITPEVNQVVLVGFLNGDASQPVVIGWLGYEYTTNEEILVVKTRRKR